MAGRFDGQVAWITGGGSGIGRALALALADEGADVAVSGRREDRLAAVVREVEARGRRGLCAPCDVRDEVQVEQRADEVAATLGRLDVCVANAGFAVGGRFEELSVADWRRQFDVNVFGLVATLRAALPHVQRHDGRLVLIGSVAAFLPLPGNGAYTASKAAVHAIGQTLAAELRHSGVSVTTIHPGFVESEIAQVDNEGRHDPSRRDPRPQRLMWSAERAAGVCVRAIHARKRDFVFTGHGRLASFLGRHAPGLVHRFLP